MNKFIILFCMMFSLCSLTAENSVLGSQINWITSYEDAVNQSKATSKPILLLFTTNYCPWCDKLDAEVFNTNEFAQAAEGKFIFVMIDNSGATGKVSPNLIAQNSELKKKYSIRGFPTVILINSKGQKIGETGYKPGGGKQYAEHLFKMLGDFSGYQQKLSNLEKQNFSGQELKQLYEKAQEFGLDPDCNKIMTVGFESDQKNFFLLERYRYLSYEGRHESQEALSLKKQLLSADPKNESLIHYHIAIIDFEALASTLDSHKKTAEYLVQPLTSYIENFKKQDKTNLWRLHMIISQVYYDKDQTDDALKHAKLSFSTAPLSVQPEIEIVIKNFEQTNSRDTFANF